MIKAAKSLMVQLPTIVLVSKSIEHVTTKQFTMDLLFLESGGIVKKMRLLRDTENYQTQIETR